MIYKNEYTGEYICTKQLNQIGWTSLKKDQKIPKKKMLYYSPTMASVEELKGLPDTFIIIVSLDLFDNECLDYANKLNSNWNTHRIFLWARCSSCL